MRTYSYYLPYIRDRKEEVFIEVLLNSKNQMIREKLVSIGSLDSSVVHPREVFREAIRWSASALVFVHNHPSGDPTPSAEDITLTRRLREVGGIMDIRVLDHIIIGEGRYFSFADEGRI